MTGWGARARESLRVLPVVAVMAAGLWVPFGCNGERVEPRTGAIGTDLFVDTYVDLRMTTLRAGVTQLSTEARDQILERHKVTEQDLLTFVEVHGRDAGFMHSIWDTIESRIDDERVILPDTAQVGNPTST